MIFHLHSLGWILQEFYNHSHTRLHSETKCVVTHTLTHNVHQPVNSHAVCLLLRLPVPHRDSTGAMHCGGPGVGFIAEGVVATELFIELTHSKWVRQSCCYSFLQPLLPSECLPAWIYVIL